MQIPAELKCCVCLSVAESPIATECPHRLCKDCATQGSLRNCPVCSQKLGEEVDEELAREVKAKTLHCTDCGEDIPLLSADGHHCGRVKKCARVELPGPAPAPNRSTFTCPWCPESNLTAPALLEHCQAEHRKHQPRSAVCPICASMPWGDPNYVSQNFLSHLELRHRCNYAVLTDFEADEEEMLRRALAESCREAGMVDYEAELQRMLQESAEDGRESNMNMLVASS